MKRKQPVKRYTESDFERFMSLKKTDEIKNGRTTVTTHNHTGYMIETGIPIPEYYQVSKFPLLAMEIGDSFVAPLTDKKALQNAITRIHKRNRTYKFITRTIKGMGRAGKKTRVWRVKITH